MFVEGDDLTATGMFLITSKLLIPALAETVYREILRSRPQIFLLASHWCEDCFDMRKLLILLLDPVRY
jgi:hypothetical protein